MAETGHCKRTESSKGRTTDSSVTNAEYSNGRKPVSEIGGEGSNPSSAVLVKIKPEA